MTSGPLLPASFFARDTLVVARDLLGRHLRGVDVTIRITEVEAYGRGDSASHCRSGRTARNAPMWGPPGHVYVYLCYGVHQMINLVTEADGVGAAVLIRGAEPVSGLQVVRSRRGNRHGPQLLNGPGKVGAALALDRGWSHHPVFERGGLECREGSPVARVLAGPRVGIGFASSADRVAPYRLAAAGSPWVSYRKGLTEWRE